MELQEKEISESRPALHHNESIETLDSCRKYTIIEKLKRIFSMITVEPAFFLYMFASLLASGALTNMRFEMGCRVNLKLKLNGTICSNITLGTEHVNHIYLETEAWSRPVQQTVSMIMVLCFGTFSDRHKIRKPFFTIPILGEVFSVLGLLLCAIFITTWPIEIFYIMAIIVPAFFGGGQTLLMAIYSYISDISAQEERTFRIGLVEIVSLILTPIGPAIAGILFLQIGYYWIYSICVILFTAAIIYGQVFIKEKPAPKRDKNLCLDVFNIKPVVIDMFKTLIRKRVAYRRFLLIMTYVCYILIRGPSGADGMNAESYAIKTLQWELDYIGYFHAYDSLVHIIGLFLAITLLTKKLKFNDYTLVIISCIAEMIVGIWYAFSSTPIMFCITSVLGVFSGLFTIGLRSVVTKLVNPSEIGKAQALFAICDALCPYIYNKMYSKFFIATKDVFYGAFYLLSTILMIIPLFLLLGMYLLYKHDLEHPQPEKEKQQNENNNGMEESSMLYKLTNCKQYADSNDTVICYK